MVRMACLNDTSMKFKFTARLRTSLLFFCSAVTHCTHSLSLTMQTLYVFHVSPILNMPLYKMQFICHPHNVTNVSPSITFEQ